MTPARRWSFLLLPLLFVAALCVARWVSERSASQAALGLFDASTVTPGTPADLPATSATVDAASRAEVDREAQPEQPPPAAPAQKPAPRVQQSFWWGVQERSTGLPIAEASVTPIGSESQFGALARSGHLAFLSQRSDAAGLLELRFNGEPRGIGRADARGFGPSLFRLSGGHESAGDALVLRLDPGAELALTVSGTASEALVGVKVSLRCASYELGQSRGSNMYGQDVTWSALTDEEGRCVLADLPLEVPLHASASLNGMPIYRDPSALVLTGGERRELHWSVGTGGILRGVLLDQEGRPIGAQPLWITREGLNVQADRDRIYF